MASERVEKIIDFLKNNPRDCFLNHALALEYCKEGDEIAAKKYFETNLENDPGYVATYYHLGKLYERIGEKDAAIGMYEKGMQIAKAEKDNHTYNELQAAYEDLVY